MNEFFYFWYFIGLLYLILLTIQDYKRKMLVDDRFNYSIFGLTLGLIHVLKAKLWYILILLFAILLLNFLWRRYIKGFGSADIGTLSWIFYGFMLVNAAYWITFIVFLLSFALFWQLIKKLAKYDKPVPFYPAITLAYFVTGLLFKLLVF